MDIFISWHGTVSHEIGMILSEWLLNVIQAVTPWISSEDIRKGGRWFPEMSDKLENTNFGILCLTKDNLDSPWMHFEAGALSKRIKQSSVCPYLFNIDKSIVKPPFSLFQLTQSSKDDTKKLIITINNALEDKKLQEPILLSAFEKWWPNLEEKFRNMKTKPADSMPTRSDHAILEEILELVRNLTRKGQYDFVENPIMRNLLDSSAEGLLINELRRNSLKDAFKKALEKYIEERDNKNDSH